MCPESVYLKFVSVGQYHARESSAVGEDVSIGHIGTEGEHALLEFVHLVSTTHGQEQNSMSGITPNMGSQQQEVGSWLKCLMIIK